MVDLLNFLKLSKAARHPAHHDQDHRQHQEDHGILLLL
jgi:hypothetical protein